MDIEQLLQELEIKLRAELEAQIKGDNITPMFTAKEVNNIVRKRVREARERLESYDKDLKGTKFNNSKMQEQLNKLKAQSLLLQDVITEIENDLKVDPQALSKETEQKALELLQQFSLTVTAKIDMLELEKEVEVEIAKSNLTRCVEDVWKMEQGSWELNINKYYR